MAQILDVTREFDWIAAFKSREIHFVCVANGGLTNCDLAAVDIGGMDRHEEVWPLTQRVNDLGETGTFHPRLSMTVVPLISWGRRNRPDNIEEFLQKSFEDVAEVNFIGYKRQKRRTEGRHREKQYILAHTLQIGTEAASIPPQYTTRWYKLGFLRARKITNRNFYILARGRFYRPREAIDHKSSRSIIKPKTPSEGSALSN